eukprot:TRINITY_DN8294_c0_g2_i1.p1 TRINITY_DN8294_c0_g2~~TRINITY_DN8294_c0_g2_i1.p1  ORF type:complete len:196 (+),score=24.81 TRINITY_DN8294_c0_g2_i1:50-637(+)
MPKHNNAIPRNHFHKHWNPESSQKGHIKTFFQQAQQKKARRVRRQAKARSVFPRPVSGCIRPVVQSCTARYNMKQRIGKGFTLEEIKAAGLNPSFARTVGIAVDARRRNHSEESLNLNTQRLKDYTAKLVLYPLPGGKKANSSIPVAGTDAIKSVSQNSPAGIVAVQTAEAPRELTADEKKQKHLQLSTGPVEEQ